MEDGTPVPPGALRPSQNRHDRVRAPACLDVESATTHDFATFLFDTPPVVSQVDAFDGWMVEGSPEKHATLVEWLFQQSDELARRYPEPQLRRGLGFVCNNEDFACWLIQNPDLPSGPKKRIVEALDGVLGRGGPPVFLWAVEEWLEDTWPGFLGGGFHGLWEDSEVLGMLRRMLRRHTGSRIAEVQRIARHILSHVGDPEAHAAGAQ